VYSLPPVCLPRPAIGALGKVYEFTYNLCLGWGGGTRRSARSGWFLLTVPRNCAHKHTSTKYMLNHSPLCVQRERWGAPQDPFGVRPLDLPRTNKPRPTLSGKPITVQTIEYDTDLPPISRSRRREAALHCTALRCAASTPGRTYMYMRLIISRRCNSHLPFIGLALSLWELVD
jgi:hypothetical protein